MTWVTSYEVGYFGIILNKTYRGTKYVQASGKNCDKVQESFIAKQKEELVENIASKDQKTLLVFFFSKTNP